MKQLASGKPSFGILDKGKSILSKEWAKDWNADDRLEDGYKDDLVAKKNQTPTKKGYDTNYASSSKIKPDRLPIKSPFKGQKEEGSRRRQKTKKPTNRTRRQVELVPTDNLTRTRVSGSSYKPTRRQTPRSKKSSTTPGYLASDESMLIPSDISDTSEW